MNSKQFITKILSFLGIICIVIAFSSCTAGKNGSMTGKKHGYSYQKTRSKQPNWNTSTSLQTRYIIKNKRRAKFHY
jgi:hypothetical protein